MDNYNVLPKEIKIELGLIIRDFNNGKCTYEELVSRMKEKGFDVTPVLTDFSKRMMTVSAAKELRERCESKQFMPGDINHFVVNSKEYSNINIRYDYEMIETMAYCGDVESQKHLVSILKYQIKLLSDYSTNEKHRKVIENWKKQINYFNEQLTLNGEQTTVKK